MTEFFCRLKAAFISWNYLPIEEMLHPEVVLTTRQGQEQGFDPVIRHLKRLRGEPFRTQIVAPKGGLITVLITPIRMEGRLARSQEQVYRISHDRLIELVDLERTPDMVYRPESQPS